MVDPAPNDPVAFFVADGDEYRPTGWSRGRWSNDSIHGSATCGIVATVVEQRHGTQGFRPARMTVDLFAPTRFAAITIDSTVVREASRIRHVEVTVSQGGSPVTKATVVFLRESSGPEGEIWKSPAPKPVTPPERVSLPESAMGMPWFGSDEAGWSHDMADHQGASRKRMWMDECRVLDGVEASGFVHACVVGEMTNLITNWGTAGVGYINVDLTVALARTPNGGAGVEADSHIDNDGIATGTTTLYDADGPLGTCTVTAVANVKRQIDFSNDVAEPTNPRV